MTSIKIASILLCIIYLPSFSDAVACPIDNKFVMNMFALQSGDDTTTRLFATRMELYSNKVVYKGVCIDHGNVTIEPRSQETVQILFRNQSASQCYFCFNFHRQSPNVLQFQFTACQMKNWRDGELTNVQIRERVCNIMPEGVITGFNTDKTDFNCKPIIEGIYDFEYVLKLSGKCLSRNSKIKACQFAGSPLRDNSIFKMTWGYCPSNPESMRNEEITYYCLGQWNDRAGNMFSAISYDNEDIKFKYRCLMTRLDQQQISMRQEWAMTIDADCQNLQDIISAPLRLTLTPGFAVSAGISGDLADRRIEQLPYMTPTCNLPKNMTGVWFYPGEYNTRVNINSTTIEYTRTLNQNKWEKVYFICKESRDNRFLMAVVTKGHCYVDFMCFHFMPRHHNLIRFRQSRPFRMMIKELGRRGDSYYQIVFREACHWSSFTLNHVQWRYRYYILDPPVPISCPIQGRFKFKQVGQDSEKYVTKIPGGVTVRPRVQVVCEKQKEETDLASCTGNPKQLMLDVNRCMTLDFTGRPISEYDVADNILTCVGYWMEDAKSFLITYDPNDPISKHFRCWVYKRIGFRIYRMSRSTSGHCFTNQTDESKDSVDGASLLLELTENEREFDGCPMKFVDGHDPYSNAMKLEVFSASNRPLPSIPITLVLCFLFLLTRL